MPSQIEKKTVFYKWNMKILLHFETFQPIIKSSEGEKSLPTMRRGHRFSAFWLRSKCSICSYQLNIWYGLHSRSRILNWFLTDWIHGWACSPGPAGCHGIALPPWAASFSLQNKSSFAYCCLWKVNRIDSNTIKYKQRQRTRSIRFFSSLNIVYLLSYYYLIISHFCLD